MRTGLLASGRIVYIEFIVQTKFDKSTLYAPSSDITQPLNNKNKQIPDTQQIFQQKRKPVSMREHKKSTSEDVLSRKCHVDTLCTVLSVSCCFMPSQCDDFYLFA
jgi:hypothetical protein